MAELFIDPGYPEDAEALARHASQFFQKQALTEERIFGVRNRCRGPEFNYIELTSMGYRSELWWFRKNQECWLTDWVRGERIPGVFQ